MHATTPSRNRNRLRLFTLTAAIATLIMAFTLVFEIVPAKADTNCQYFPETQHSVCGRFLAYWQANGQLAQQGYPISDEFTEMNAAPPAGDGRLHTVQYFQRARFEYHPENAAPYDVLLGLLGSEQFRTKYADSSPVAQPTSGDCKSFPETGYSACGLFLAYWNANGGLAQQGYPISNVILEQNAPPPAGDGKVHRVQYFQRARFEEHLENAAPYQVLLGLLGSEQLAAKYPNGAPTNAAPTSSTGATTTTTAAPSATATTTAPPASSGSYGAEGCLPAISTSGNSVQACVDKPTPTDNSTVTVFGRLVVSGQAVSGVVMNTSWHYKTVTSSCSGTTDSNGVASCARDISRATKGYTVEIDVSFGYNGQTYTTSTSFTPQ